MSDVWTCKTHRRVIRVIPWVKKKKKQKPELVLEGLCQLADQLNQLKNDLAMLEDQLKLAKTNNQAFAKALLVLVHYVFAGGFLQAQVYDILDFRTGFHSGMNIYMDKTV